MARDEDEAASASHVAVKLPTFWSKNPRSWFVSVEAQFMRAKITQEETRYWHVLSVLPCEVVDTIHAITENPGDTPYTALKNKLLGTFTPSKWQSLWHVMDIPSLAADQKPSTLLDLMAAHLPPTVKTDNEFFHAVFLRKLPAFIKGPLMAANFDNIQQMAEHADKIWGAQEDQAATNAVLDRRPRSPSRRNNQQRNKRADTPGKSSLCFYHRKFGKKAHSCTQPCSWQPSGNAVAADDSD